MPSLRVLTCVVPPEDWSPHPLSLLPCFLAFIGVFFLCSLDGSGSLQAHNSCMQCRQLGNRLHRWVTSRSQFGEEKIHQGVWFLLRHFSLTSRAPLSAIYGLSLGIFPLLCRCPDLEIYHQDESMHASVHVLRWSPSATCAWTNSIVRNRIITLLKAKLWTIIIYPRKRRRIINADLGKPKRTRMAVTSQWRVNFLVCISGWA